MSRRYSFLVLGALVPALSFASIGKIVLLQGSATKLAKDAAKDQAQPVSVGAEIDVGDTVSVAKGGNAKIALNDDSVLMVSGDSSLQFDEANFAQLDNRSFKATLLFGKVWANVRKALSGPDAKFEVSSNHRAVAGVRGTIFRVDTAKFLGAVKPKTPHTIVSVVVGKVAVEAQVKPKTAGGTTGQATTGKKERHEVAGPSEVSKDEWEKRFVELQKNQQIRIGDELWQQASFNPETEKDAFAEFVRKNQ